MERTDVNVLIGGEAGQGLVTLGELLAKSLVRAGYFSVVTQSYHSRIRGGHNTYTIRASAEKIVAPREEVDLLVALNPETVALHKRELSAGGLTIVDKGFETTSDNCLQLPYVELGEKQFSNVVALGVVSFLLGLELEMVGKALDDAFGKKAPELAEKNMQILAESYRWCSQQGVNFSKLAKTTVDEWQ